MKEKLRFLGLDVHAETIAVAIAEPDGEVRSLGTIPNRLESIRKLKRKIITAVARELLGFIWAIGTRVETTVRQRIAAWTKEKAKAKTS
jgi:hypothetical protein